MKRELKTPSHSALLRKRAVKWSMTAFRFGEKSLSFAFFPSASHMVGESVDFLLFVWFDSLETQTNQRDAWCRFTICLVCLCQRPVWIRSLLTNLSSINGRDCGSTNICIFKGILCEMSILLFFGVSFLYKKSHYLVSHDHFLKSRWPLDSKQAVLAILAVL